MSETTRELRLPAEPEAEPIVLDELDSDLDEVAPTADLVHAYLAEIGRTRLLTAAEEVELAKRIEAGVYAAELLRRADAGEERLDDARRSALAAVAADGSAAKAHMLRANLRLVVSVAKKFTHRAVPFLDLVQEGNLGLIRAVEKFDYRKGYKFSTYAMWWIRQAIGRGLAEQSRTIRLPAHVHEQMGKVRRAERALVEELGRPPSDDEVARALGLDVARVEELRRVGRDPVSLDTPIGNDGDSVIGDLVTDTGSGTAVEAVEYEVMVGELRRLLRQLPERQALVLRLRYGLDDGQERNLTEVGRELGLSRERVRQLEREALLRLRDPRASSQLLDWAS